MVIMKQGVTTNYNLSSRGGLGGKCKTMFTKVFISSPGGLNQLGSKLCRVSLNKKEIIESK